MYSILLNSDKYDNRIFYNFNDINIAKSYANDIIKTFMIKKINDIFLSYLLLWSDKYNKENEIYDKEINSYINYKSKKIVKKNKTKYVITKSINKYGYVWNDLIEIEFIKVEIIQNENKNIKDFDEELKKNSGKIITWQSVMEEMMNRRNIKSALAQPLLINLP